MSENPVYLKAKQITKLYGFSRNTWLGWVDSGHAPAGITFSKRVTVWDKKDVDAFVEKCRQAGRGQKMTTTTFSNPTEYLQAEFATFIADRRVSLSDSWLNHASKRGLSTDQAAAFFKSQFCEIAKVQTSNTKLPDDKVINFPETEWGKAYDKAVFAFNRLMKKLAAAPGKYAARHKLFSMVRELAEAQREFGRLSRKAIKA